MSARSCQPRASLEASRRGRTGRNPDSRQGHIDLALRFVLSFHQRPRAGPARIPPAITSISVVVCHAAAGGGALTEPGSTVAKR